MPDELEVLLAEQVASYRALAPGYEANSLWPHHEALSGTLSAALDAFHLSTTGTYLERISTEEIISTVHARRAPMMHASAGLAL
jgi:hypothetical protein